LATAGDDSPMPYSELAPVYFHLSAPVAKSSATSSPADVPA
jgi:hypothetical protein